MSDISSASVLTLSCTVPDRPVAEAGRCRGAYYVLHRRQNPVVVIGRGWEQGKQVKGAELMVAVGVGAKSGEWLHILASTRS